MREKDELLSQLTSKLQASVQFINKLSRQCEALQIKSNEEVGQPLPTFQSSAVTTDSNLQMEVSLLKKRLQAEQEKHTEEIQKRDVQLVALTKDLLKAKSVKPNK